ncbi:hypothetical protein [Hymenobacter rubripertinctus]|uniref:STAS/SEC14 domain-containing protein n=1 Tax=Hymenobacter rubripertinctus TaxID=2029981 RepID=A0A418R7I7_9BACT|nr:hypothetical protein [Hymenobacter rubripertinctus]RIY13342.1 hypothetical protein D0T11_02600 [Hymenobacter rubripertinctus]
MNSSLLRSEELSIDYRSDLGVLIVRWLTDASAAELRQHYAALLTAAQQVGCTHWLLDVRRRLTPHPEHTQWAASEWMPTALSALGPQTVYIACLLAPLRAVQFSPDEAINNAIAEQLEAARRAYHFETFTDEGEAIRWLRHF